MTKQAQKTEAAQADTAKQPWAAPQMIEIDAVAATLAGGALSADSDPNQPS